MGKEEKKPKISVRNMNVYYQNNHVLRDINIDFYHNTITAIIGPSGSGKSTFIAALTKMLTILTHNSDVKCTGSITLDGNDIDDMDDTTLRRRMVTIAQTPTLFPGMSIFENVAYGLRLHGMYKDKDDLRQKVEFWLKKVGIYEEVNGDLTRQAVALSGGQKQRVCVARAGIIAPEVLIGDEITSAIDHRNKAKVEHVLDCLRLDYTILMVTHDIHHTARIADYAAFFENGYLVEYDKTDKLFTVPKHSKTLEYITGRFG